MSESAGKTSRAAEVAANVAGATERRRVQSIREPLSPGAYVEYSVDDQPGVVERARAYLAGAPCEPVAPRRAATVMLVSEGKPHYRRFESPLAGGAPIEETVDAAPVDVFMLRRASTMAFTPDAVVFPGGGMDARDVECAVPWAGPSPEQWARLMSCTEPEARGIITAAAREVFEESGVLLASAPGGAAPIDERGDHWACEREAVATRQISFGEFLRERGLVLRSDLMRLRSHWVTPESEARRYDTYFFLARLPEGQHADGRHERGRGGGLDRPGRGAHAFRCRAAQARAPDYLQSHLHRGSDLGGRGVEHSLRRARAAASGGAGVRRGGARLRGERDMSARFTPPDNEAMVGPFAQCVRHPNATPLTYHGTNSWILAAPNDGACVVVDPGPDDAACIGRIAEACARRGLTVAAVAVTHDHFDHAECAEEAGRVFGAPVLGVASGTLGPGPLELPGVSLAIEVVPLPGHSSDSVGFLVEEGALVVTGDVVFAQSPTMVCWPDGRMGDYLASLDVLGRLVAERGVERLLTGHGPVIENPSERIEQAHRHRLQRLQQVVSAVRSGIPADAEALVEAVYNDVRPELHDGAVRSVNAQLRYAFDEGILQENR